jgi:exodeoxyribonuclease V gamma subunit
VPIGELLDVVGEGVVIRHPLQPFDPRNFEPGRLVPVVPWSFDANAQAGAVALQHPREAAGAFLTGPLPPLADETIELADLVRFVEHPVRRFLRRRLGIDVRDFSEEVVDDLGIELDALERWGVGDRLLASRMEGVDARQARLAEIARGRLPPGQLGAPAVQDAEPVVEAIVAEAGPEVATSVDVRVELPDGRIVAGTVPDVCGTTLRTATFSRLAARHRIAAWVRLLALTAAFPSAGYDARIIGKRGREAAEVRCLPALTGDEALAHLVDIVAMYDDGMRAPLPLICKTSAAYAESGDDAAAKEWTSEYEWPKEDADAEHVLALGGQLTYEELSAMPDFPELAHRLWDPVLARETR